MNSAAPASRAAWRISPGGALRRPSAMLSATLPGKKFGRCGTQAIWPRQASTPIAASPVPPASTVPAAGSVNRSNSASSELLPAPLGPVTTIRSPGAIVRLTPVSAGRRPPGKATVTSSSLISAARRSTPATRCTGGTAAGGVSRMSRTRPAAATPSMLAWNWLLTARSGRYASGVSSSTTSAVSYPMWPYSSRSPTSTATSAVATAAASSSTSADKNATRRVDMVAAR